MLDLTTTRRAAIEQRLRARGVPSTAAAMIATQVAAGQIALLEAWMTGKLTAERAELAAAMTHYPAPCDEKPE